MRITAIIIILAALSLATSARGQLAFTEVSGDRGIGVVSFAEGMASGVAAADFDGDGFVDLFIPNGPGTADQLYRNAGDGNFIEMAGTVGLADVGSHRCALWLDYDGDGRLDLLVVGDDAADPSSFKLLRQRADGTFEDRTSAAGLVFPPADFGTHQRSGLAAGDLDRDGDVEFVSTIWNGPIHVFSNDGDGTFSDVSTVALPGAPQDWHHQPVLVDIDSDGWLDLFVAVDFGPNQFWVNQRDGTFQNVAVAAGADNAMNDMGVSVGDYDNDGDWDFYITNIENVDPQSGLPEHNVLLRNDSTSAALQFTDVSTTLGVGETGWGWGVTFFDADNSRWLDIAVTNGWRSGWWQSDQSRLFLSNGGAAPTFTDASTATGFDDTHYGASLIALDFDRDGDLDLVQTVIGGASATDLLRLLENAYAGSQGANHFLVVRPRMQGANTQALGATVRVAASGVTLQRLIAAGTSYLGQEPAEAFFGLGTATIAESVAVIWPDGTITTQTDVAADQVLLVTHGGPGDLNADGAVSAADVSALTACLLGPKVARSDLCFAADLDRSGAVDVVDYAILQRLAD